MNKEDYVSLEVAKLLKEKGYNEPCEKEVNIYLGTWAYCDYDHVGARNSNLPTNKASYPTLYEAAKWLRNNHQLHIDVGMCGDYSTDADGNKVDEWEFWTFDMYYTTNFTNHIYDCKGEYDTYEEALNEGIFEALKLI